MACIFRPPLMERGEIWFVSLAPTADHEQQGTRLVLIVTPAAFNRVTRLPIVVSVTSGGNFARTAGLAVSLDGAGIRTTGVVRCDQHRTIDMKARGGKRLERVPETIMNEVLGRLSTILDLNMGFEGQPYDFGHQNRYSTSILVISKNVLAKNDK